ncbi:hypothetical protein [Kitasatospora sp. NBC_01266]|uniref:hypothetical protein n=1 Tax=Kitasatospora sp. NBC_01266 TaxID=2903572 RepID=UPI002E339EE2|nr:hypothetical protein [Kitasatospora sp. NBC_01266]
MRYLALHRHGGIEIGLGHLAYQVGKVRVFPLRRIVGLAWITAALQTEVVGRWAIDGPFEITVALRNTSRATLGAFAEGWAEPGQGLADFATCLDEHLLLHRETDGLPDPETFALDLGDRVEQAFGTVHRRHLARRGEHEGGFDPRFQVF